MGGEAGIDYDGQIYISDEFQLNNNSGMSGPDGMPGGMSGMDFGPANGSQQTGSFTPGAAPDFGSGPSQSDEFSGGGPGGRW